MILNMLTAGAMIKTGKTYESMIDLKATNEKLKDRAINCGTNCRSFSAISQHC
ncbi:MAG: hypothetical protein ACLSA2_05635 [Candidatus Gastranaerophilaceae bacterium]